MLLHAAPVAANTGSVSVALEADRLLSVAVAVNE
jgi:hypothetical protein